MTKVQEYKIEVRQFLTRPSDNPQYKDKKPVPMRTMFGYVLQETPKGVKVRMKGKPEISDKCTICGRKITHPTSLLYGIGSECINKVPFAVPLTDPDNIEEYLTDLKEKMADVTWEGWLPKDYISMEPTEMIEPWGEETEQQQQQEPKETTPKTATTVEVDETLVEELVAELNEAMSL